MQFNDKYPHIEITDQEIFDEIQKIKHRKDYLQKLNRINNPIPNWTPNEYLQKMHERLNTIVQAKNNDFDAMYIVEPNRNYEILAFMCYYFANDLEGLRNHAEKMKFCMITPAKNVSTEKGLMILGNTGRGKSLLFKAFNQNPRKSYLFVESKFISDDYKAKEMAQKSSGIDSTRHFSSDFESTGRSMFNQKEYDLCIDDFGVEECLNIYGNKVEATLDVLMSRLNTNRITHISTNLSLEDIEKRYGSRLISRFYEQMNILYFPKDTPDYRKL